MFSVACARTASRSAIPQLVLRHGRCIPVQSATLRLSHNRLFSFSPLRPLGSSSELSRVAEYNDCSAWPHPVYTEAQMKEIKIAHRKTRNWSDYTALSAVRLVRWCFDRVMGYKHPSPAQQQQVGPYEMTEEKWLTRFIFLESIAGVPGMVAGMVRHLHSLRLLRSDKGWIATLLEESQNERMHLLTFLQFRQPGLVMRTMLLAAQGVFFNVFFLAYLISPATCHRFVGYLEEEAVITYSRTIADLEAGKLPRWQNMEAPQIAKEYFRLEEGRDRVRDLLLVIKADEAKHREVNHTLANLEQNVDPNPFEAEWNVDGPKPSKGLEWIRNTGWEREELQKIAGSTEVKQPTTA